MIREDRELLAELARLNGDMASLALRITDESASGAEQSYYAQRLIAGGERLKRRADGMGDSIIEGEFVIEPIALPAHAVEPDGDSEGTDRTHGWGWRGRGWQRGQVWEERFMKDSRRIAVPHRRQGRPSCR